MFFGMMLTAIVGTIVVVAWLSRSPRRYWRKTKLRVTLPEAPVLLASISKHGELVLIADGYTPNENRYSYVMGMSLIYSPKPLCGLYSVELPFASAAHIVSVSYREKLPVDIQVRDSALEEMVLEGDYPNYFTVYVDQGEQSEGRYVLDPKAMAFTIDFCQQFSWEIVDDTLFFLSSSELPSYDMVEKFIEEIRPAISTSKPVVRHSHDLPYVTIQPLNLNCPICQTRLKPGEQWLACPNDHGAMLTGKQLIYLRRKADPKLLSGALKYRPVKVESAPLSCPHCHAMMRATRFQNSDVYVDVCTKCRFRWLDYHEVTMIAGVERVLLQ